MWEEQDAGDAGDAEPGNNVGRPLGIESRGQVSSPRETFGSGHARKSQPLLVGLGKTDVYEAARERGSLSRAHLGGWGWGCKMGLFREEEDRKPAAHTLTVKVR